MRAPQPSPHTATPSTHPDVKPQRPLPGARDDGAPVGRDGQSQSAGEPATETLADLYVIRQRRQLGHLIPDAGSPKRALHPLPLPGSHLLIAVAPARPVGTYDHPRGVLDAGQTLVSDLARTAPTAISEQPLALTGAQLDVQVRPS